MGHGLWLALRYTCGPRLLDICGCARNYTAHTAERRGEILCTQSRKWPAFTSNVLTRPFLNFLRSLFKWTCGDLGHDVDAFKMSRALFTCFPGLSISRGTFGLLPVYLELLQSSSRPKKFLYDKPCQDVFTWSQQSLDTVEKERMSTRTCLMICDEWHTFIPKVVPFSLQEDLQHCQHNHFRLLALLFGSVLG